MYILIFFFFFFSIIFTLVFGRFLGKKIISLINIINLILSILLTIFIYYEVVFLGFNCDIILFNWLHIYNLNINFHFFFDFLSVNMLLLILLISFFVQIFSIEYMWKDDSFIRFLIYINLFTFFMIIMVLSGNLIQFFLGWEGIGLSSYLLINFWYIRPEANRSAIKAILINKLGDFGLYFSIIIIYLYFKTFDFNTIFLLSKLDNSPNYYIFFNFKILKIDFICFFLMLACVGKSAQLGLHNWLPDAMEGPTPVSALLHSATMVTAGIYLIIRFSHLFEFSINILNFISIIALLTILFSSFIAMGQYDLKKIIAYSTTSQLGYMFLACGSSQYFFAFQHLFDHAFFKAVLFLGAGSIIYCVGGKQDIREFGGLYKYMPITYLSFFIGTFSLLGFPSTSGFYSKESIIESIFLRTEFEELIALLTMLSVSFSAYYSIQLFYILFHNNLCLNYKNILIEPPLIKFSLIFLSFIGLVGGYLFFDIFSTSSSFFQNSFYFSYSQEFIETIDDLNWYLIINLPLYLTFISVFLGMFFQKFFTDLFFKYFFIKLSFFVNFFNRKWFFDLFLFTIFIFAFFYISYLNFFKFLDRAVLELFGPTLLSRIFFIFSNKINLFQTGQLHFYTLILVLFIFYFIIFYFFILFDLFFILLFYLLFILLFSILSFLKKN